MALNGEVLKANEALSSLSEDQVTAIETLSKNDEEVVIGKRIGELHGQYDADVLAESGMAKEQGEKSYNYAKRVIGSYKESVGQVATLSTEIAGYKTKITDYEAQIAKGAGNEVIVQKLKDTETKLGELQGLYDTDKLGWTKKEEEHNSALSGIRVNGEFGKINLKFKSEYPASIQKTLVDSARSAILSKFKPDWIDNGTGGTVMVFRDQNGTIQNNPENKLNPFTADELMKSELKDVIDLGRSQGGGGGGSPSGGGNEVVDLSAATTQVEADEIINTMLLKKGLTKGSQEFAAEHKEIRSKGEVSKLPMRKR